jgi:hypothetical protein
MPSGVTLRAPDRAEAAIESDAALEAMPGGVAETALAAAGTAINPSTVIKTARLGIERRFI